MAIIYNYLFQFAYSPLLDDEFRDQEFQQSLEVDKVYHSFTGLTPNSPYQVVICAFTDTGCGVNVTMNWTTNEDG